MKTRVILVSCLIGASLFVLPAQPAPASVLDADDVQSPLDIRFVDVDELDHGKTRFTLTFHDRVPPWMLRQRAALVDLKHGTSGVKYFVRFKTNPNGLLRTAYADYGSFCCRHSPAHHPDPFTYRAVFKPFFMENNFGFKPDEFRGRTAREIRRPFRHTIDRTRWVPV